ncbi:hypothetical protein D3C75_847180 [compost metagenome]
MALIERLAKVREFRLGDKRNGLWICVDGQKRAINYLLSSLVLVVTICEVFHLGDLAVSLEAKVFFACITKNIADTGINNIVITLRLGECLGIFDLHADRLDVHWVDEEQVERAIEVATMARGVELVKSALANVSAHRDWQTHRGAEINAPSLGLQNHIKG